MPITAKQRRDRRNSIGASDMPAVMNTLPQSWNRTKATVIYEKVLPLSEDQATESQAIGNWLEGPLVDWAAKALGVAVRKNQRRVSKGRDNGVLSASFDALCRDGRTAIEAKSVGGRYVDDWGEPETDQVPEYVLVQCQTQCYVGDLDEVRIAAALSRFAIERAMYRVKRHEGLIDLLVDSAMELWETWVLPNRKRWNAGEALVLPDDTAPPIELLRTMRRLPGAVTDLDETAAGMVAAWEALKRTKSEVERDYDQATARVLAALGQAEAGRLPDGRLLVYMQENAGSRLDVKALRTDQPFIWERYARLAWRRVLRIKGETQKTQEITNEQRTGETASGIGGDGDSGADGA